MWKKIVKSKMFLPVMTLILGSVFMAVNYAQSVVYYPPVASLGVGDIKSSHIRDGSIINADVSSTAYILSSKIGAVNGYGKASSTWSYVIDRLAGLATTSGNLFYSSSSDWAVISTTTLRQLLGFGDMSLQASNSVAISGGTITGITDLGTADGGTGQSWNAAATGSLPYFSGKGTLGLLATGTTGQVLSATDTAQGIWWGPTQSLAYTSVASSTWTFCAQSTTWEDYNIAPTVPAGAKYAEINVNVDGTGSKVAGLRPDGSALARTWNVVTGTSMNAVVEVGATGIIERYCSVWSNVSFSPVGYWQ